MISFFEYEVVILKAIKISLIFLIMLLEDILLGEMIEALANCWVIVLAPLTIFLALRSIQTDRRMALKSTPGLVQNVESSEAIAAFIKCFGRLL